MPETIVTTVGPLVACADDRKYINLNDVFFVTPGLFEDCEWEVYSAREEPYIAVHLMETRDSETAYYAVEIHYSEKGLDETFPAMRDLHLEIFSGDFMVDAKFDWEYGNDDSLARASRDALEFAARWIQRDRDRLDNLRRKARIVFGEILGREGEE